MGWFTKMFCPNDGDLLDYIDMYEDMVRNEDDPEEIEEVREFIEGHGWHQEQRGGHRMWNKKER